MPLWLMEEPHCRMEEWMALKMRLALLGGEMAIDRADSHKR